MEQSLYHEFSKLEAKHWWFTGRRRYLQTVIERFFNNTSKLSVCEIGCGTGGNLGILSQFVKTDAVEMNDDARQLAKEKQIKNAKIHSGYLPDNIPLTEQYDGVFALDVVEHVEDDLAAIKRLKSLVNKDGLLITTVPAYQWLWSKHDIANHHFRRYTKKRYCQLIESAGLEVCYASYFNTILFPLAVLSRLVEFITDKFASNQDATLSMPTAFINRLFSVIFNLESLWASKISMPFGLSIIVVAKHKTQ